MPPALDSILPVKAMIVCLFGLGWTIGASTATADVIAAFVPMANHAESIEAEHLAKAVIFEKLERRGVTFVDPDTLRSIMRSQRLRLIGMIDSASADLIASKTGAQFVITGSIDHYLEQENPEVCLSFQAYDCRSHRLVWAASEASTGEDQAGIFGLGRVEDARKLLSATAAKLVDAAPDLTAPSIPRRRVKKHDRDLAALGRLAVFPMDNNTTTAGAGALATSALLQELWRRGYELLPPGEVAALQARLTADLSVGAADTALVILREERAVVAAVTGIVTKFVGVRSSESEIMPEVEISLRLIDPVDGSVIASITLEKSGSDSETLFGAGRLLSVGKLTQRAVADGWNGLLDQWKDRQRSASGKIQQERSDAIN
jgi:hypothetical protein